MGMYTRLVLNATLNFCAGSNALAQLQEMISGECMRFHDRRDWMLKSSSYYHGNINVCKLEHDKISELRKLSVVCDLKNYDSEIDWFLNWLAPYSADPGVLQGYVRYEAVDFPDLVYFTSKGSVAYVKGAGADSPEARVAVETH